MAKALQWQRLILASTVLCGVAYAQTPTAPATLEQRLVRLERLVDNQKLIELFERLESLQKEVESLRGEVEFQTHTLQNLKKRQRDLYVDIDHRIRQIESGSHAGVATPPGAMSDDAIPLASAEAEPAAYEPTLEELADPAREADLYKSAFNYLKVAQYGQAIAALKDFLRQYSQGAYADNAQYWLGEAYYVTRDFRAAVNEFRKVVEVYPNSGKMADSQLKIGFSYYELADYLSARTALDAVIKRFPQSTAARLADKRLQQMKLEGR